MREQGDWVAGLLVGLAVEWEERRTNVHKNVAWWLRGGLYGLPRYHRGRSEHTKQGRPWLLRRIEWK